METLSYYPDTLLHVDYGMQNFAHNGHAITLAWQLASRPLMSVDLAWFTKWSYIQKVMSSVRRFA